MTLHITPDTSSSTAAILEQMALHGAKPPAGEPDNRPLPAEGSAEGAIASMVDAMMALLSDTQLEDDLDEMLWSLTNIFHRRLIHIQRLLDDNESEQRELITAQDGSEVKSLELERQTDRGVKLIEHRDVYETMRDLAADHYRVQIGSVWTPRTGSRVSHRNLTAAVIESRSFISAKRRQETETHCPAGTRIAFTGGDYQDHMTIWAVLDQVRTKYPDMILLHGGTPSGAELIAAKWADNRGVTQVPFRPDWKSHGKAAPFKRNDELLKTMPQGIVATPGSGITENLVDKARKLGIAIKRIGS